MTERLIRRLPVDTGQSGWLALSARQAPVRPLEREEEARMLVGAERLGFRGLLGHRGLAPLATILTVRGR